MSDNERVVIFDTTLRDGEQSPGISLDVGEKLEIAEQLARLGVDYLEAGFPVASQGDFEAVEAIARAVRGPVVTGLSRTALKDVDRCWEAVQHAEKARIHVFIATSENHMKNKLKMTPDQVKTEAGSAVRHARGYTDDVEFSPEDASRSDFDFMCEVLQIAVDAGATTLNIPDTVGFAIPQEYAQRFRSIRERVTGDYVISAHCHDDLGMAVANSLAAVEAGARQVEVAMNGIGERAGNAALEEIVMALRTRSEYFGGLDTNVRAEELAKTSRLVARLTGYPVQYNKAVVGRNAFAHEAGIHQHGVLANPLTYEIMDATSVGLAKSEIVLGKHSGRHALRNALHELGYELDDEQLNQVFVRFKNVADRKGELSALDLDALMGDEVRMESGDGPRLTDVSFRGGSAETPEARVTVTMPDGATLTGTGTGDGPVDALMRAVDHALGTTGKLLEYSVSAVTSGTDALGEARVVCEIDGRVQTAQGVSPDVLEASAIAYLRAVAASQRAAEERVAAGGV
jgi:2-isopropylmalate synthase